MRIQSTGAGGAGGGGYATIFDLRFNQLPAQVFGADGAVTLGGVAATKRNSSLETTHAQLLGSGSGLQLNPAATTDYFQTTYNAPGFGFSLSALSPLIVPTSGARALLWIQSDNAAADFDGSLVSFEDGPGTLNFFAARGFTTNPNVGWVATIAGVNQGQTQYARYTQDTVLAIEMPNGPLGGLFVGYAGTYDVAGDKFPAFDAMETTRKFTLPDSLHNSPTDIYTPGDPMTSWNLFIGARKVSSATNYKPVLGRLLLQVRL